MSITSNLYPPICPDTCPAFIRTKSCKIYFSLSMYNSAADIKNVQISLVNQRTNASALKTSTYPSGIKIASLYYDPDVRGDYNYYVQINPSDLAEGSFGLNQFYKVQLRFTSKSASNPPSSGTALAKWLYDNMQYFSEWSKVCLIKGIEQPHISIRGFDDTENSQETVLTNPMLEVIGKLTYAKNGTQEKEYLKSYNIKLYQANNMDNVLMQSEEIYTNPHNPNEFNYQLLYDLLDGVKYVMALTYTTNNLYTETINYKFTVIQYGVDKLNADITATVDEENGRIKIDIISKDTKKFIGNLTIRRTSSESNFHKWEDVKTVTYMTGTELNYSWYDTTIQSGVWYRYCAQKRNAHGDRGAIIQIDKPVICLFDDIFLTRDDCQLKIKFNPTLSEFKYNVAESQQVTIGAKYPYIKRNGNNYFRTFPIGGLISSFIDTTDWYDPHFYDGEFHYNENEIKTFTSKADIYGESQKLYDDYNNKKGITEYNDYIYEREFRKKVYDFLYKHNVKLFRSTTEGNILIKLMNIDFQPVETLGRRLYSFTATAVEVDDVTIANYNKYGIQITGNYEKYITYRHEVLGQISGTYQASDGNILSNKIDTKYKKSSNEGFINQVGSLRWLKLEIESDPYVIIESGGQLVKATTSSDIEAPDATVGHIVVINGAEMIVYPRMERRPTGQPGNGSTAAEIVHLGIFELKEDNTLVTDLRFKYPTTVTIDYIANLEEVEDTSGLANRIYYYHKPGQLYGSFEPKDSLMRKIYNKYLLNYKKYYQRLLDVTGIQVEGQPGAVVYVKDSKDTALNRHVLENGYLQLRDNEATIEGLYFCGVHLTECTDPLETEIVNGLTGDDFKLQDGIYNSIDEIKNPVNAGIYQIRAYGLKSGAFLQNNRVIAVNKDNTEHIKVTPDNYYTLILESIEDDKKLQFVYYYGYWYTLAKDYEKTKLLDGDIRQLRDNEYILVNEHYNSFAEIKNPIPNGVYWISSYAADDKDLNFDKNEDYVYTNVDKNYDLIVKQLYEESKNRYIYYHGGWWLFTPEHDVLCPVDGLVDYYCEVVKGVY